MAESRDLDSYRCPPVGADVRRLNLSHLPRAKRSPGFSHIPHRASPPPRAVSRRVCRGALSAAWQPGRWTERR